jgi:hypothetical protein
MFIDLSNLVSMQGEMVDRIEDHINSKFPTVLKNIFCCLVAGTGIFHASKTGTLPIRALK